MGEGIGSSLTQIYQEMRTVIPFALIQGVIGTESLEAPDVVLVPRSCRPGSYLRGFLLSKETKRQMFGYVFMKILERRPRSYDRTMEKISRGCVHVIKQAVVAEVFPGMRVLEIGCGTGELAAMLVSKGATVDGFDLSAAMIEVASERIASQGLHNRLAVKQMGVDSMDGLPDKTYDAVISTLALSEFADDERRFALRQAFRVLKPGGILVIADEVLPRTRVRRLLHALARGPVVAATYLISRRSTRPLADLQGDAAAAGFSVEKETRSHGDAFEILVARRTGKGGGE